MLIPGSPAESEHIAILLFLQNMARFHKFISVGAVIKCTKLFELTIVLSNIAVGRSFCKVLPLSESMYGGLAAL